MLTRSLLRPMKDDNRLRVIAHELADLFREGRLADVPRGTRIPVSSLARILSDRCPGFSNDEYADAMDKALRETR